MPCLFFAKTLWTVDLVSVLIIALILFSDGFAMALIAFFVAIVEDFLSGEYKSF